MSVQGPGGGSNLPTGEPVRGKDLHETGSMGTGAHSVGKKSVEGNIFTRRASMIFRSLARMRDAGSDSQSHPEFHATASPSKLLPGLTGRPEDEEPTRGGPEDEVPHGFLERPPEVVPLGRQERPEDEVPHGFLERPPGVVPPGLIERPPGVVPPGLIERPPGVVPPGLIERPPGVVPPGHPAGPEEDPFLHILQYGPPREAEQKRAWWKFW